MSTGTACKGVVCQTLLFLLIAFAVALIVLFALTLIHAARVPGFASAVMTVGAMAYGGAAIFFLRHKRGLPNRRTTSLVAVARSDGEGAA